MRERERIFVGYKKQKVELYNNLFFFCKKFNIVIPSLFCVGDKDEIGKIIS